MDPRHIIVSRIDMQMRRHLDQPVDTHRAVNDVRYAKDLLLVCEAMEGTELPQLASQYREAEQIITAARRALAPRPTTRVPTAYAPAAGQANVPQRPVNFGRGR